MTKQSSHINIVFKRLIILPFLFGLTVLFAQRIDLQENKNKLLLNGKVVRKYNDKKLENKPGVPRKGEFEGNTLHFVYTKKGMSYIDNDGKIVYINWVAEDYKFKKKR